MSTRTTQSVLVLVFFFSLAFGGCLQVDPKAGSSTTLTRSATAKNATFLGAAAYPDAFFADDADTAKTWTFSSQMIVSDNGLPLPASPGDRVVNQKHPLAAGWHPSTKEKFSGSKSWTIQDERAGGYHDNEYVSMVSPSIDLSSAKGGINLSFVYKAGLEDNTYDGVTVSGSVDGSHWTPLVNILGSSAEWTLQGANLTMYAGKKVQLQFLFKSDTTCSVDDKPDTPVLACGTGTYTGVFVDDIVVKPE